jgi:hypothetical protein
MSHDELPYDPDQQPLPPITPEELEALAGRMEAMYLERGDPSPEEAVALYRAADEIRRLKALIDNQPWAGDPES